MKRKKRRGLFRPRNVSVFDNRSPMLRLLQDGQDGHPGHVEVYYDAQFKTLQKAMRLALIDHNGDLTETGYQFLAKEGRKNAKDA